jgi:hypothetical protein
MKYWTFALILLSFVVAQTIAVAQSPPPATFVYKITMGGGPGTGSMDYTMDVAIISTQPDGARKATLTLHAPKMMPVDKKQFDATISPFGVLTVASTGEMPKNDNPFNMAAAKQMAQAAQGPQLQMMINPLNVFANGFAKAPTLKQGATWHVFSNETGADVQYTVAGREQRNGRDTVIVTMQNPSNSGATVSGQGNYDTAAHLVVNVHCEIKQTPQDKNGQIIDVAMANP